jgi:hypothetical protein
VFVIKGLGEWMEREVVENPRFGSSKMMGRFVTRKGVGKEGDLCSDS